MLMNSHLSDFIIFGDFNTDFIIFGELVVFENKFRTIEESVLESFRRFRVSYHPVASGCWLIPHRLKNCFLRLRF